MKCNQTKQIQDKHIHMCLHTTRGKGMKTSFVIRREQVQCNLLQMHVYKQIAIKICFWHTILVMMMMMMTAKYRRDGLQWEKNVKNGIKLQMKKLYEIRVKKQP